MWWLFIVVGVILLVLLIFIFGPRSFLRYYLYTRRMFRLYEGFRFGAGLSNFEALKEISRMRHPELNVHVHERMISKFNTIESLLNFVYWGLEVYIDKRNLTDENALRLIDASEVVVEGQKYSVIVDKERLRRNY